MEKYSKEYFMNKAFLEAKKAEKEDEVPIGAVIVLNNKIVGRGHNRRDNRNLTISHAELEAICKANRKLDNWRLVECDIYVTLEPCLMCMGAILQARFRNLYFGAYDSNNGATEFAVESLKRKNINHYPNIEGGILNTKCSEIISHYFQQKRKKDN